MQAPLIDPFARAISYLRVSVTDRCDFRCAYCMTEHMTFLPKAFSYVTDSHSMKFGVELRRTDARLLGILNTRGILNYVSPPLLPGQPVNISTFVNDIAQPAPTKNFLLAGGDSEGFYRWHEFYAFAQDEWRIRDNLTLTLGVRYEYPGH